MLKGQRATETPSTPGFHVVRNISEAVFISDRDQKLYRGRVGMLLFLVKHTRQDLSNSTRELSKVMDKATKGHMKELCRLIKYAIDTKNKGLKLRPEDTDDKWRIKAYSMQILQVTKKHE